MARSNERPTALTELSDEDLDQVAGGAWTLPTSLLLKVKWPSHDYGSGTCNTDGTYTP
jgi:hypothetical protein